MFVFGGVEVVVVVVVVVCVCEKERGGELTYTSCVNLCQLTC